MNYKKSFIGAVTILLCTFCMSLYGANPYLPLWEYIPDGEPYVFEDPDNPGQYRVYIYGSHDSMKSEYCGREQVVWSASVTELNNWRYDGIIFESKIDANGNLLNADGLGDILYAPDIVEITDRDGSKWYYFYPNNQAGGRNGMVARSRRPDGPFEVCNWSKHSPRENDGVLGFDPAVFVDDDGKVYGYWGFERSYGAELDPSTMATVKPGTEIVVDMVSNRNEEGIFRFFEASSMRKIEGKYVFIYSRWSSNGEFGLPDTNYTLAYAYSDSPLGPFTYGGTIIDARGRDTDENGAPIHTATPSGNTHGSIAEINGQWYVFYHRQTGLDEYARQAMVAPIDVKVENGKVIISEAEYTSEGFETEGLNPYNQYSAGIACYYTGTQPSQHNWPKKIYYGSYVEPKYLTCTDCSVRPYSICINSNPVVNNTSGSVVGYKYYNFNHTYKHRAIKLLLNAIPKGVNGKIEIYIDNPPKKGGKKVGTIRVRKNMPQQMREFKVRLRGIRKLKGKHAIYFVFSSGTENTSICDMHNIAFTSAQYKKMGTCQSKHNCAHQ